MNKFQRWLLRKIFSDLFVQGFNHHARLAEVNALIREVWEEEFYEDNSVTTDSMLREAFESTQYVPVVMNDEVQRLIKQIGKATHEV